MVGREFLMQPDDYGPTIAGIHDCLLDQADQLRLFGWQARGSSLCVSVLLGFPRHRQREIEVVSYPLRLAHGDLFEPTERRALARAVTIQ